jgi:glycosyltransferase 2 family protein
MTKWAWVRLAGGVGILALVVWRVGTGPFVEGVRTIDGWALAAALGIGGLTTLACAWRWSLVASGLGVRLPLAAAVAAYYRSQFLNTTLPGGVIGDVHRAVRHGRDIGDVTLGVRAVVLERTAGQGVAMGIALMVLFAFPSPVRAYMPIAVAALVVVVGAVLLTRALVKGRSGRLMRALRAVRSDIRNGLLPRGTLAAVVVTSSVVLVGHLATFLVAARTAGSTAPLAVLTPVTLLALLAMMVPLNIAGWGPREGVAAWAFGAAGLTAAQGVATAVTYGVLVLVASLPGAAVLGVRWFRAPAAAKRVGASAALEPGGTHG